MKRLLSLFLAILILTSCSNVSNDDTELSNKSKSSLSIYHMAYDLQIKDAISLFNRSNSGVTVFPTEFTDIELYREKVTTETLSGEGPDIFLGLNTFTSIRKVISSGVFCDLNELISKDKDFKISEYNKNMLDCGIFDGKRYILPRQYNYYGFYTAKNFLDQNNISIDDSNWTWKDFANIAKEFAKKNKGKDKYLVGWNFGFKAIMTNCGISFIDYDNKEVKFDSLEFIELLQCYKDMYPAICTNEIISRKKADPFQLLNDGTILLIYDFFEPHRIYERNAVIKNSMKLEPQLVSMPTYKSGGDILARLSDFVAINSNCKNKEQAFKFLKVYLSKENRQAGFNSGISTNNKIFREELEVYLKADLSKRNKISYGKYTTEPINISQEIYDKIYDIVDKTKRIEIIDEVVYKMISDELPELLSGKKSAEKVAKEINDKVKIYINE